MLKGAGMGLQGQAIIGIQRVASCRWGRTLSPQPLGYLLIYHDLFFFFLFFDWDIVALQCCVGFWCAMKWINSMSTWIPTLLDRPPTTPPSHPLGRHRAIGWAPVPCSSLPRAVCLPLVVCYVSFPVSHCIPHPLCPPCPCLFFTSASLFLPWKMGSPLPFF